MDFGFRIQVLGYCFFTYGSDCIASKASKMNHLHFSRIEFDKVPISALWSFRYDTVILLLSDTCYAFKFDCNFEFAFTSI